MLPKSPLIPHCAPSKGEVGSVLMYKAVGAEKRTRARELERVDWVLSACFVVVAVWPSSLQVPGDRNVC